MIALGRSSIKIHLALDPCDMRKSFNGLYDIACQHVDDNRLWREAIFVFTNKRRNRIKLLYFDGTGLWVAANSHAPQCAFWFGFQNPLSISSAIREGLRDFRIRWR